MRSEASFSGEKSGWLIIMWIMVGTMVVVVTWYFSISAMAAPGSNIGMRTNLPPKVWVAMTPTMEAAWKIGVCSSATPSESWGKRMTPW